MVSLVKFICLLVVFATCLGGLIVFAMQMNADEVEIEKCVGIWKSENEMDTITYLVFHEDGKGHLLDYGNVTFVSLEDVILDSERLMHNIDMVNGSRYSPAYKSFIWERIELKMFCTSYAIDLIDTKLFINVDYEDDTRIWINQGGSYRKVASL